MTEGVSVVAQLFRTADELASPDQCHHSGVCSFFTSYWCVGGKGGGYRAKYHRFAALTTKLLEDTLFCRLCLCRGTLP